MRTLHSIRIEFRGDLVRITPILGAARGRKMGKGRFEVKREELDAFFASPEAQEAFYLRPDNPR